MGVGQAYLLDDIISLVRTFPFILFQTNHFNLFQLKIDGEIFAKVTLTYGLGEQHVLLDQIRKYNSKTGNNL